MKNVIYINCWVEPWVKVAQRLEKDYDYKPVWWIGYSRQDNSHNIIPSIFPDVIYQDDSDAWKGRFPKEVEEKAPNYYLDVDFLRRHSQHELQAIKMMDRVDQDLHSFNFMERQRHFRNMLKSWMAAIDFVKPDLVISTAIPHRLYDYVLFWLCEEKGIPFLTIQHTQFPGRLYFSKNQFYTIENRFIDDWHSFEKKDYLIQELTNDIKERFESVKKDYEEAAPSYMAFDAKRQKKATSRFFMLKRWIKKFTTMYRPFLLGQPADTLTIGLCAYDKKKDKKYEESDGNIYQHERMLLRVNKYKDQLQKTYESLCVKPNYNEDYVILFLHYQPEATTCPGGDIFVDQRLCVELLLKNLPKNWKVYVKEHPHQFIRYRIGHTSRMRDLYDDLVKNERVKLISTEIDSFELIRHTKAVSTITGTVGWEAMVRQKPVIAFGLGWYENYSKGVLRITDEKSAENMYQFIENYQYDEHSLLAYLASVGKNTRLAYYFKNMYKKETGLGEEECINNIVDLIVEQMNA